MDGSLVHGLRLGFYHVHAFTLMALKALVAVTSPHGGVQCDAAKRLAEVVASMTAKLAAPVPAATVPASSASGGAGGGASATAGGAGSSSGEGATSGPTKPNSKAVVAAQAKQQGLKF